MEGRTWGDQRDFVTKRGRGDRRETVTRNTNSGTQARTGKDERETVTGHTKTVGTRRRTRPAGTCVLYPSKALYAFPTVTGQREGGGTLRDVSGVRKTRGFPLTCVMGRVTTREYDPV